MPFNHVRAAYELLREQERLKLKDYLSKDTEIAAKFEFKTGPGEGRGRPDYTLGEQITPYDLSNWKWIELEGTGEAEGFNCVISFNMPTIDPSSKRPACLYDRMGLKINDKKDVYTGIDLPLTKKKMEQIAQLVLEQYDIYCQKKKEA